SMRRLARSPRPATPWNRTRLRLEALEERLTPAFQPQLLASFGQVPLGFEVNAGQTDARAQFLAHGSGYALFLTSTGAVLNLQNNTPVAGGAVLAMNLVDSNPDAAVVGQDQLPGVSNYFVGDDPSQWHTDIATFGRVEYQSVYPGVNLTYH